MKVRRTALASLALLVGAVVPAGMADGAGATPDRATPGHGHAPRRADLAVASIQKAPAAAAPGSEIAVQAVVVNRGRARAKATPLQLLLSRDGRASADDVVAGATAVSALGPGRRATRQVAGRVPATATGQYRVVVCLKPSKRTRAGRAERRNDCEVGPVLTLSLRDSPPPSEPFWSTAQVTGELHLRQSGKSTTDARDRVWDRWGDIVLSLTAEAPPGHPEETIFTDVASHYNWSGYEAYTDGGDQCTYFWQEQEAGDAGFGGALTARFLPGTVDRTLELTLPMSYTVSGSSGLDCRVQDTWKDTRTNRTVLLLERQVVEGNRVHYVGQVQAPADSIWDTVAATVDLEVQRPAP